MTHFIRGSVVRWLETAGTGRTDVETETIRADLIVLATGYKGQEHLVAKLFGNDVATRVGPIWGLTSGLTKNSILAPRPV